MKEKEIELKIIKKTDKEIAAEIKRKTAAFIIATFLLIGISSLFLYFYRHSTSFLDYTLGSIFWLAAGLGICWVLANMTTKDIKLVEKK